ncbi:RNA polymerase sigma factor [Solicola gregarius]|uniref:RNA polymerase sigma factor n=1 Tax=Solicola gregarius TaxID=2908642 RepID=A0AA46YM28_9ACTN|nr:RNA polymerase sigma factor [Solicola gregarius]UYM07590.1 RNA polymerase sigma factor [Solicola gregarius]
MSANRGSPGDSATVLESRSRGDAPPIRNVRAWTSAVASRVAVDSHRSRERDANLRERLAARWSLRPPEASSEEERVLALAVAEGLGGLTDRQRQVIVLRFYADLHVSEIATLLDVAEGTVKSRLHSATGAIRARLQDKEVI